LRSFDFVSLFALNKFIMRKTTVLFALLAIVFSSFNAFAEGEDEDRRKRRKGGNFGVHLNVSPMFSGTFSANLEYGLNKNMSTVLTLGFVSIPIGQTLSIPGEAPKISTIPLNGFMAAPEFRYYFNPNRRPGLDRWFVGGYLKVRSLATSGEELANLKSVIQPGNFFPDVEVEYYDLSYFGLSAGATAGYMVAMKSGLTFGAWIGLGYTFVNESTYTNNVEPALNPFDFIRIDPRLGVTIGYRF
jgi:hypothetical protein